MLLINPEQRGALIKAVEENGTVWDQVASTSSWNDPKLCENGFLVPKKDLKAKENIVKKKVMGTGGGPFQPEAKDDLSQLREMIEPEVDGMFTIYDSDSKLMAQYQETLPDISKAKPIEMDFMEITEHQDVHVSRIANEQCTPQPYKFRTDFLRKRKEPALCHNDGCSKELEVQKENCGKELEVQKENFILNTPNSKIDFLRKRKEPALYRNGNFM